MKALTRKLLRDIGHMRGAVFTISLVVAAGIAAFVTLRGTYNSITATRDRYYSSERFGDVFCELERAPNLVHEKLAALPGVARAYTRVTGNGRVPIANQSEPARARVISLPDHGVPPLNGVKLMSGRMPLSDRDDEALINEFFAHHHGITPGTTLDVVIEGHARTLRIVGLAMSPEFVLAIPDGASAPAPERFAVLWMARAAAEAAFDLRGSFNSVVLDLAPGASAKQVMPELEQILDAYGARGAQSRERQVSNFFLTQDLGQLAMLATVAPLIFLGVAAFLLNVVLSRLIELDRPQIATLKAIGYANREVGLHYLQLTLVITLLGSLMGVGLGVWLGGHMTALYLKFYRMPNMTFQMDMRLLSTSLLVSLGAGLLGSLVAVRRVIRLPPAEAMRPLAPPHYAERSITRALIRQLSPAARMVAREITRRPLRTLLSAVGIGAATGIIVVGQHFEDALHYLVDFYLQTQQRETLLVGLVKPVSPDTVHALRTLPGVVDVQWQATVQVRLRAGPRSRDVPLVSHPERHAMRPLIDDHGREVPITTGQVLFTDVLARVLDVAPGDEVIAEPLEGDRTPRRLRVTGTLPELMALWAHMPEDDFASFLGTAPFANQAMLAVDRAHVDDVQRKLLDMPLVGSAMRKDKLIEEFRDEQVETMRTFSFVLTLFAVTIAVSVVYNNARVALSMRSRELASLRVLGFTRQEISSVLISELAVQVLIGIPIGLLFGEQMVALMLSANDPESFRFPISVSRHTFAFAALVTILAAAASALLVRKKLDKLDLIGVLKTRD